MGSTFSHDDVVAGRVLSEDDDFLVIELGKRDDVAWTVEPLAGESNHRFYTMLFCSFEDGYPTFQKPWEKNDGA